LNFSRSLGLLLGFAVLALAVVHLRMEQTRATARWLDAQAEWSRHRRELWMLQARAARQKTPTRIHESIDHSYEMDLLPPGPDEHPSSDSALTAAR